MSVLSCTKPVLSQYYPVLSLLRKLRYKKNAIKTKKSLLRVYFCFWILAPGKWYRRHFILLFLRVLDTTSRSHWNYKKLDHVVLSGNKYSWLKTLELYCLPNRNDTGSISAPKSSNWTIWDSFSQVPRI